MTYSYLLAVRQRSIHRLAEQARATLRDDIAHFERLGLGADPNIDELRWTESLSDHELLACLALDLLAPLDAEAFVTDVKAQRGDHSEAPAREVCDE